MQSPLSAPQRMQLLLRQRRHPACMPLLSLLFFLSLLSLHQCPLPSYGSTWDRAPFPSPQTFAPHSFQLTLDAPHLFARTLRKHATAATAAAVATDGTEEEASATDAHTLLFLGGGKDGANEATVHSYLFAWPHAAGVHSKHAPPWVPVPLIGAQPAKRDSAVMLVAPASSGAAGLALLHAGATQSFVFSSLWALDLEHNVWLPLGPARLAPPSDPLNQECGGQPTLFRESTLPPSPTVSPAPPSVDECYWSRDTSMQVDEFDCPWPSARQLGIFVVVGSYAYVYGGGLQDWTISGEVWRLPLDEALWQAAEQQQQGREAAGGIYTYNEHQLRYLRDKTDPLIERDALCPVKWELLTRPSSSSLLGRPSNEPSPGGRAGVGVAVSGSRIYIVGGVDSFVSTLAVESVWYL